MLDLTGPTLPVATCGRRLEPADLAIGPGNSDLAASISWNGPAHLGTEMGSEATVQARCGLMHLHGRDLGRPRRIGLEVASVAAGLLAAQGTLAALIGRARGFSVTAVETSVLQAGLMLVSHFVAAATGTDEWVPAPAGPAPGPPFRTADGHWVEIETLDPEAWKAFWYQLGAAGSDLGRAWALFRARYYRSSCSLAAGMHEATARHTLTEISRVAGECRVSLTPVRLPSEVLAQPGWSSGIPVVEPWQQAHDKAPPKAPVNPPGQLPLEGIRVVEATTRMQGPLAGLLLQMLGAHVMKVEPPGGDFGRIVPPLAGDTGSFFLCFNRGKETVEIDLTQPSGRSALVELVAHADVFLHNWRPGKAAEWGLDAVDLLEANPRLVYTEASGWGDVAVQRHLIGTDFLVQAYAGLGAAIRPQDDPPVPTRVIVVDFAGALIGAEGALRGLYQRERTGRGAKVRTSLLQGAMALQDHVLGALARGEEATGRSAGRPVWGPLDQPVPAADGLVVVTVEDDTELKRLCRVCGVDVDTNADRSDIELLLNDRLASESAAHWEKELTDAGIPCAALALGEELATMARDPRFSHLFETLAGPSLVPNAPWRFSS